MPLLKEGDIVIVDNLNAHKNAEVVKLIESKNAQVMYLPPYSPDFNPIEMMWSKVKSILRKIKAESLDCLNGAIKTALHAITKSDAQAWFKKAGCEA